jgi:hypothetical protein
MLRFGSRKLWLPRPVWRWMLGTVRFIQRVDDALEDTMHIDLLISHPLFGEIFGYTDTFRVIRTPVSHLASRVT